TREPSTPRRCAPRWPRRKPRGPRVGTRWPLSPRSAACDAGTSTSRSWTECRSILDQKRPKGPGPAGGRSRDPWGQVSVDGRVGVLEQLFELRLEPVPGDRRVRQRTGRVVPVTGVTAVGRVAHPVEALALVVRDLLAGTVRLTRRLHPDVGVDTRSRVGARTLAETSAGLVAPVALVDPAVDPRLVDPGLQVSRVARAGGPVRATPTVTRGVDQHADVLAEASLDQPLTERLSEA